jgi:valyl-tRNA synthetase
MPFITEEIFCTLQDEEESIMISDWPVYKDEWNFASEERSVELIKEAVRGIRNVRTQMNVAPSRKAKVFVVSDDNETLDVFREGRLFFESLAYASESVCQNDKSGIADDAVSVALGSATVYIPFTDLVDISAEIERLTREQKKLEGELARSKNMLSNERFLSKAPESKIAEEKEKQQKYQQTYDQITERLQQLKG